MYVANSAALFFAGRTPLDGRRLWQDKRRLLGDGKTIRGTVLATLWGVLTTTVLIAFFPGAVEAFSGDYLQYGILLALGAVGGDIVASFFKRRMGYKSGESALVLDQLDFVVGGLLLGSLVYVPSLLETAVILLVTPVIHNLANRLAYWLKIKTVPW